jgi:hypothetical protein
MRNSVKGTVAALAALVTGAVTGTLTLIFDYYRPVTENLGRGVITTNYGQAGAVCASVFGQQKVSASSAVAATCQSIATVNGWCTVAMVPAVLLAVSGGVVLIILFAARVMSDS